MNDFKELRAQVDAEHWVVLVELDYNVKARVADLRDLDVHIEPYSFYKRLPSADIRVVIEGAHRDDARHDNLGFLHDQDIGVVKGDI